MGLFETQEVDDLDLLLYGKPEDSDTDTENAEIICHCGQGRGRGAPAVVERTVPRLPQAAIHHRIALMESDRSGLSGDSLAELRASSPSSSSQGSRRGRGRARTLRENAAAIPQVGLSRKHNKKPEDAAVKPVKSKTDIRERAHTAQKAPPENWLREEEFPTLAASNSTKQKERVKPREKVPETQQDNVNKQEKENNYLADEIIKAGEDATTVEKHNLHVNIEAASNCMQKTNMNDRYSTEPSPKINKNNFMKQSLLSYQKLLPDGYSLNKKFGNRRNMNHHAYSLRDKKDTSMDRFVLNDDLPEYCKYEVTHADIEKHRGWTLGVPGAVKDKVSMWLNSQEQTSKVNEESNSMKSDPVDYKENVVGKEPDYVGNDRVEEYSGVIGPEARDVVDEEKAIHQESLHVYSDSSNSRVIEESAAITTDSKSNSVLSQIDSEHNDVMNVSNEDNNQIKEMTEEINELDLNTSSTNMCQNSFDFTTENTSFYISDEESNLLLDNMKSTTIAQNHRVDIGDSSSFSSSACLSESDFVTKYQTSNNKKKGKKPKSSGASMESDNVWRLDGPTVIQVDGLNRNCVLSHLEDMVSGFGMVSDCEQKTYRDKLSVRFKLDSEDACEFAVQCLHDTDCIYPDFLWTLHTYEPLHEKTNVLASDLVLHKSGCTATEDG